MAQNRVGCSEYVGGNCQHEVWWKEMGLM